MKKKHLLGMLFLSATLLAQEAPKNLNLQLAIDHALTHNRSIKNADLNILAAIAQKWETTAAGLPQINGKIEYTNNIQRPFDVSGSDNEGFAFFFPKHNITPNITLTQLLFDGSYLVGLQAAKVYLDISKNAKEKTNIEIETAVIRAYGNVLLSKESIEIQRKNIRSLRENLQETTQIYENGFAEEENVQQLQLTLSSLENNLKNLENIHRISKGFLKLLLGMPLDTPIALTDDLSSLTTQQLMWSSTGDKFDLSNNIDYKIARNEVESKRLLYKRERFKKLPTVAAFVSASRLGYSDSFSNYFNKGQDWLSTSVAGASISIPIFTSLGGEALIKRTKINWQVSQNNLKETEEKLQLDIEKAESEYILAIDTYHNKTESLSLATNIEYKNALKYKEGMASSFELRQAQLQLYSSQQEYLQSMIEVINKKAEFKKIANIQ